MTFMHEARLLLRHGGVILSIPSLIVRDNSGYIRALCALTALNHHLTTALSGMGLLQSNNSRVFAETRVAGARNYLL